MPGTADANSLINDKLQSIFGPPASLDQRLVSSAKKILLERIEFESAKKTSAAFLNNLRAKYAPLNATSNSNVEQRDEKSPMVKDKVVSSSSTVDSGLCLDWRNARPVGVGLVNLGNTCFLNSVLQCLVYTPALVNYLTTQHQPSQCRVSGLCMLCELCTLIRLCLSTSGSVKPLPILRNLKAIAKHMKWGRQEDAHEFLRYVVDAMQRAELTRISKPDAKTRASTATSRIFGGFLRSQVVCLECRHKSCTYDPFLDISLDIRKAMTVESGLQNFVAPELLSKDNAYKCSKCCKKVAAKKSFSIHVAPNVLTVQFKRYSVQGGKISRHIGFSQTLDIRPFMSERSGEPVRYVLYAVLLHDGFSTNSGHYYCYVAAPNKKWHCMNDSSVYSASISHVLQSQAYLLFYRKQATSSSTKSDAAMTSPAATPTSAAMPSSKPSSASAATNSSKSPGLAAFKPSLITDSTSKPKAMTVTANLKTGITSSSFKPTMIANSTSRPNATLNSFKATDCNANSKPAAASSTFKPNLVSTTTKCNTVSSSTSKPTPCSPSPSKLNVTTLVSNATSPLKPTVNTNSGYKSNAVSTLHSKLISSPTSSSKPTLITSNAKSSTVSPSSVKPVAVPLSKQTVLSNSPFKQNITSPSASRPTVTICSAGALSNGSIKSPVASTTTIQTALGSPLKNGIDCKKVLEFTDKKLRKHELENSPVTEKSDNTQNSAFAEIEKRRRKKKKLLLKLLSESSESCRSDEEDKKSHSLLTKKKKKLLKKMLSEGSVSYSLLSKKKKKLLRKMLNEGKESRIRKSSSDSNNSIDACDEELHDGKSKHRNQNKNKNKKSVDHIESSDDSSGKKKKKRKNKKKKVIVNGDISHPNENTDDNCIFYAEGNDQENGVVLEVQPIKQDSCKESNSKKKRKRRKRKQIVNGEDCVVDVNHKAEMTSVNNYDEGEVIRENGFILNGHVKLKRIQKDSSEDHDRKKKKKLTLNGHVSSNELQNIYQNESISHDQPKVKKIRNEDDDCKKKKKKLIMNGDVSGNNEHSGVENRSLAGGSEKHTVIQNGCIFHDQPKVTKIREDNIQKWDEILPTGYRSIGIESKSGKTKAKQSWDGMADNMSADIVRQLEKFSHGYGVEVTTWEGGRPVLDQESAKERRLALKRSRSDLYNDEIDQGRVHKVKKYQRLSDLTGVTDAVNPFQKLANRIYH